MGLSSCANDDGAAVDGHISLSGENSIQGLSKIITT